MTMKIKLSKLEMTRQEQQEHVAKMIGNLSYHACNEVEEKDQDWEVKQIKTKYDKRGETTTFVASATVCWSIYDMIANHDLIKMLVSRLTDEELEQLSTLRSLNNISITTGE